MRLILTLILSLPLLAQLPVELMRKPSLSRSVMAAGVNVTGGVDTQSIASIPPGTATITRGANSGASTDDPVVSNSGWTFDSGDRVSGLPAKGAAWTTTNCSGVECYTVTSSGAEYMNGEARRNLLRWSEALDNAVWSKAGAAFATCGVSDPMGGMAACKIGGTASTGMHYIAYTTGLLTSTTYTISTYAKAEELTWLLIDPQVSNVEKRAYIDLLNKTWGTVDVAFTSKSITDIGGGWLRIVLTFSGSLGTNLYLAATEADNDITYTGDGTSGVLVYGLQIEQASSATTYQKTTDSREWALETVGNYTGLLTWWGRWDRVLGPGEVNRNYWYYQRPQINAKGNSLP